MNRRKMILDGLRSMRSLNIDSEAGLSFLTSQLEYLETQVYEVKREPLDYEALIPISTDAGPHVNAVTFRMREFAGRGKRHSGQGGDVPRVDVFYDEKSIPVVGSAIGYAYTFAELRTAAALNQSLDGDRQETAMKAWRSHMNQVGLYGEDELTGLFNSPHVAQASAGVNLLTATPGQALEFINEQITQLWISTKRNSVVNTIAMPGRVLGRLSSTPRSDNSDTTILEFIKRNNVSKTERNIDIEFRAAADLETAGKGKTSRMMFYEKSRENIMFHIPMPLMFHAPEQRGLEMLVNGEYRYSGVEFRYPGTALYVDDVTG
ncbi:Protein of unknown function DUF2184 [Paraburkholderia atlantica]|uniref:DUF2184 domain-containing protein n=1 Tax=Paraburkholderia atlantica TaxID=2654982 RepID=D5WME2_PARAM|nr:major capsid family protein [Paraburkholderia atlantica]ADG20388.1 Protein of unknown function DUF2184 [Paraburkholderia atlantica]